MLNDENIEWEQISPFQLKILLVEEEEKKDGELPAKMLTSSKSSSNAQTPGVMVQSMKGSPLKKASVFNYNERKISISAYNSKPSNEVLGMIK